MLFITHEPPVTVLAVNVRLHEYMSNISQGGWSVLIWAAFWGHAKVVTQLLEASANTDLQHKVRTHLFTL